MNEQRKIFHETAESFLDAATSLVVLSLGLVRGTHLQCYYSAPKSCKSFSRFQHCSQLRLLIVRVLQLQETAAGGMERLEISHWENSKIGKSNPKSLPQVQSLFRG